MIEDSTTAQDRREQEMNWGRSPFWALLFSLPKATSVHGCGLEEETTARSEATVHGRTLADARRHALLSASTTVDLGQHCGTEETHTHTYTHIHTCLLYTSPSPRDRG
eukprot:5178684-Amphidinium_carterae.1